MIYGNLFQEYHGVKGINNNLLSTTFHFVWILMTAFIVMAFHGNLKSSLVRKNYEDRTMTLNEMIDKDMIVHVSSTLKSFLENSISQSEFNKRMLCQARKKDSVYPLG